MSGAEDSVNKICLLTFGAVDIPCSGATNLSHTIATTLSRVVLALAWAALPPLASGASRAADVCSPSVEESIRVEGEAPFSL
jgi:hypothetical protein